MTDDMHERAVFAAGAMLDRALGLLATLAKEIRGPVPVPSAEAALDGLEDHLDAVRDKLRAALARIEGEMDRLERESI